MATFRDWVDGQALARGEAVSVVLEDTARAAHVSVTTLRSAYRGMQIAGFRRARAVSEVTGGDVSIEELCS